MLVTGLKIFKYFKSIFALFYNLKEILFFYSVLIIVLFLLFGNSHHFFLAVIVSAIVLFVSLLIINHKKKKDNEEIKKVIRNIYLKRFNSDEDIILPAHLSDVEAEMKNLFLRNNDDIEYLKKLERIRTEFLGNVSHELRTPIFAIQGFIETLLTGAIDDPKVNKSFLEKANTHTKNLNNLLNDLIDISMIESGEMRLSFRYNRIKEFLSSIVNEFIPLAQSKGLELKLSNIPDNLELYFDRNRMKQVLNNLIQNAIKYTDNGKVEIIVDETDRFGIITVKDTGIGIEEESIPRIFERFYRVDKARSREVGGTGLGLAIVKHIVEAHGSKVEVISQPGIGSSFGFKLKK